MVSFAVKHIFSSADDPVPGGPKVVLPCACSALDDLDEDIVAGVVFSVFVLVGLVELMRNKGGSFGGSGCEFLFDCGEIGAVLVVFFEAGDHVEQVLSAHPAILMRDVVVHVPVEPLWREIECLCSVIKVGDAFSGEKSAL